MHHLGWEYAIDPWPLGSHRGDRLPLLVGFRVVQVGAGTGVEEIEASGQMPAGWG